MIHLMTLQLTPPAALQPPDPSYSMRPVLLADVPALCTHLWPDVDPGYAREFVTRTQQAALSGRGLGVVIVQAGGIIAYGQVMRWTHCAEISDLVVRPDQRGRGVGTALIQYLVEVARTLRVPCVEIGAAHSNPRALALYRRLGFVDARVASLNLGNGLEPVTYLRLILPDR